MNTCFRIGTLRFFFIIIKKQVKAKVFNINLISVFFFILPYEHVAGVLIRQNSGHIWRKQFLAKINGW